jgi:uncharacterized membrane protein YfcA
VDLSFAVIVAGLLVGGVVGLTGMGGGALMTPVLVVVFGVPPFAAVSSDLVANLAMKPVGSLVHLRRGSVHLRMAGWLALGAVPSGFAGALVIDALGDGPGVGHVVELALGVALVLAVAGIGLKAVLARRRPVAALPVREITVKPVPTVLIGVFGGFVVGLTSVGSGSLMIVLLLFCYPALTTRSLVGTDLVQSIPLVAAAAAGHLVFGEVRLGLAVSLIIGAVPGVYLGARASARASGPWLRWALAAVLLVSGVKLIGAPDAALVALIGAEALAAAVALIGARVRRARGGSVPPARRPAGGDSVSAEDHPAADGDVGRLVDKDEAAGLPVAPVGVGEQRRGHP